MTNAASTTARKKPGPKARSATAATGTADTTAATGIATPATAAARTAPFKFELNSLVVIKASKEQGQVRARADWTTGNRSYLIAYMTTTKEFKENWIDEDLLSAFTERRARTKPAAA